MILQEDLSDSRGSKELTGDDLTLPNIVEEDGWQREGEHFLRFY